jgi:hypothetical protein
MKTLLVLIGALTFTAYTMAGPVAALFPVSGEITGWTTDTAVAVYDTHTIWQKIDGGAIAYVQNGMQTAGFQNYTNNTDEISIQLYELGTAPGARTVYTGKTYPGFELVAGLGDSCRIDKSPLFNYVMEFIRNQYYCTVTMPNTDPMLAEAKKLAGKIDTHIQGAPVLPQKKSESWGGIKSQFKR